jgi:hypothetical protein
VAVEQLQPQALIKQAAEADILEYSYHLFLKQIP